MKPDIINREDLHLIVSEFYIKLLNNEDLIHFFEKFKNTNTLKKHINTLVDFWDNILFYSGTYNKNAMQPHVQLHQKKPFSKKHFDLWLKLFNQSVDENFKGNNAHTIKTRALSIATIMKIKTLNS
ncbi:MAG: group III truncated hemoglobin [Flavobacteriaceae bacterium]|nr:group III truncated hemoglobin [Flavobacteriaceae bacterium]